MRNGRARRQARPIVIEGRHHGLCGERARPIQIADQLFFLVSILSTGLGPARYSVLSSPMRRNCSSRYALVPVASRFALCAAGNRV